MGTSPEKKYDFFDRNKYPSWSTKHLWFEIWVWWSSGDQLRRVNIYPAAQGYYELTFRSWTVHEVTRYAINTDELLHYITQLTTPISVEEIAL